MRSAASEKTQKFVPCPSKLAPSGRTGSVRIEGPPRLAKALPRWFIGSPFTPLVAAQEAAMSSQPPG